MNYAKASYRLISILLSILCLCNSFLNTLPRLNRHFTSSNRIRMMNSLPRDIESPHNSEKLHYIFDCVNNQVNPSLMKFWQYRLDSLCADVQRNLDSEEALMNLLLETTNHAFRKLLNPIQLTSFEIISSSIIQKLTKNLDIMNQNNNIISKSLHALQSLALDDFHRYTKTEESPSHVSRKLVYQLAFLMEYLHKVFYLSTAHEDVRQIPSLKIFLHKLKSTYPFFELTQLDDKEMDMRTEAFDHMMSGVFQDIHRKDQWDQFTYDGSHTSFKTANGPIANTTLVSSSFPSFTLISQHILSIIRSSYSSIEYRKQYLPDKIKWLSQPPLTANMRNAIDKIQQKYNHAVKENIKMTQNNREEISGKIIDFDSHHDVPSHIEILSSGKTLIGVILALWSVRHTIAADAGAAWQDEDHIGGAGSSVKGIFGSLSDGNIYDASLSDQNEIFQKELLYPVHLGSVSLNTSIPFLAFLEAEDDMLNRNISASQLNSTILYNAGILASAIRKEIMLHFNGLSSRSCDTQEMMMENSFGDVTALKLISGNVMGGDDVYTTVSSAVFRNLSLSDAYDLSNLEDLLSIVALEDAIGVTNPKACISTAFEIALSRVYYSEIKALIDITENEEHNHALRDLVTSFESSESGNNNKNDDYSGILGSKSTLLSEYIKKLKTVVSLLFDIPVLELNAIENHAISNAITAAINQNDKSLRSCRRHQHRISVLTGLAVQDVTEIVSNIALGMFDSAVGDILLSADIALEVDADGDIARERLEQMSKELMLPNFSYLSSRIELLAGSVCFSYLDNALIHLTQQSSILNMGYKVATHPIVRSSSFSDNLEERCKVIVMHCLDIMKQKWNRQQFRNMIGMISNERKRLEEVDDRKDYFKFISYLQKAIYKRYLDIST